MFYSHTLAVAGAQASLESDRYDQSALLRTCFSRSSQIVLKTHADIVEMHLPIESDSASHAEIVELAERSASKPVYTIVGEALNLRTLAQVLYALYDAECLISVHDNLQCKHFSNQAIDVYLHKDAKQKALTPSLLKSICDEYKVDIIKKAQAKLHAPGLLVMDMDSTVIAMECIDEIAGLAGVKDQVADVTERAMRGEIDFTDSLHHRVACLAGVAEHDLLSIRKRLPFMPGFIKTMAILKQHNWTLAIASGGFTYFANYVKEVAGLDAAFSNQLEIKEQRLSGKVLGKVVDGEEKAAVLKQLSERYSISQAQTVAIGDGANDLIMMRAAGSSVAYHAKPAVSEAAGSAIRYCGFEGLLYSLS